MITETKVSISVKSENVFGLLLWHEWGSPIWVLVAMMNLLSGELKHQIFKCQCKCLSGGGFSAFGQAKPVVTPFGQAMAGPMVSSNPFLVSMISCSTSMFYTWGDKVIAQSHCPSCWALICMRLYNTDDDTFIKKAMNRFQCYYSVSSNTNPPVIESFIWIDCGF